MTSFITRRSVMAPRFRGALGISLVVLAVALSIASETPLPQSDAVQHTFTVPAGEAPGFDFVATHPPLADAEDPRPTASLSATLRCTLPGEGEVRITEHALPPTDGINRVTVTTDDVQTFEHVADLRCTGDACDIGIRWQVERGRDLEGEVQCELNGVIEVTSRQDGAMVTFGFFDLEGEAVTPESDET